MRFAIKALLSGWLFLLPFASSAFALDANTRLFASKAFEAIGRGQYTAAGNFAASTRDTLIMDAVEWYTITRSPQIPEFPRIARFLSRHNDWPSRDLITKRGELALLAGNFDNRTVQEWFRANPPVTAYGKYRFAESSGKTPDSAMAIDTWINGDLTKEQEAFFRNRHGPLINAVNTAQRVSRLLWEGKTFTAKKYLPSLTPENRLLFDARIALRENRHGIDGLVKNASLRFPRDEGLLYDRAHYRYKRKNYAGLTELIVKLPPNAMYPEKWWVYRNVAIREALEARSYGTSEQLAANPGELPRIEMAEALWLRGWIAVSYRNKPQDALSDFKRLYELSQYPISKARGAYWASIAAGKLGDKKTAQQWLYNAAKYPTSFYGQLAAEELYSHLQISAAPEATPAEVDAYLRKQPMAMLIAEMGEAGAVEYAMPFINHLMHSIPSRSDAAALSGIGIRIGRPDISIRAAKEAMRHGYYFMQAGYPTYPIPTPSAIDPAMTNAFIRQESMFHPRATSPANARGMMQILPSTGKVLARRVGMGFTPEKLYEPAYNIQLGNNYLNELMGRFGGSLVMTAAGYNAGPGRPIMWRQRFGTPTGELIQKLNWMEMIPFLETRNYVQRIAENYQVYRWKLGGGSTKINMRETLGR